MTEFLALEDLLSLCRDLGDLPVRDVGLLHAAAERHSTTLYGRPAYSTIDQQAGALMQSIARNHALIDGNTRLAWLSVVVFYGLNGFDLEAPDDDAYALVIGVSIGELDVHEIATALARWARPAA